VRCSHVAGHGEGLGAIHASVVTRYEPASHSTCSQRQVRFFHNNTGGRRAIGAARPWFEKKAGQSGNVIHACGLRLAS
jgi:hypothetical protein